MPVLRAHSESINLTLSKTSTEEEILEILNNAPGVTVVDNRSANQFPEPIYASGQDDILVGTFVIILE